MSGAGGAGSPFDPATVAEYTAAGHWDDRSIADLVAGHAAGRPDDPAFIAPDGPLTWRGYHEWSGRLARALLAAGHRPGERMAVLLTGGALVHVTYLAAQKAGLVTVGIGPRAGDAEVRHLLRHTGAITLVTRPDHRGRAAGELAAAVRDGTDLRRHLVLDTSAGWLRATVDGDSLPLPDDAATPPSALGPDELFFINSTSGTTGLPKCVMQTMNVRKYFGPLAARAAGFGPDEVFGSVVPSPYGFGQWSAHVVPAMYGYPTVLVDEFDPDRALRLVERHRITVLAAVTSQFVMMLRSPEFAGRDLSSLRTLFTGGEPVPYDWAAELEDRTGCAVLQFYGSNEAGPISVTSRDDPRPKRLGTAGRPVPAMQVRLFAADGGDVTATGGPGQCAARGPGLTPGYYRDDEANRQLFHPEGWMLTGDLAHIDEDGYLSISGRVADVIIRGGHNISVRTVEEAVAGCPGVARAAVVPAPSQRLGERVCAYVVTTDGEPLALERLRDHLAGQGVSKQSWPELVVTLPELPLSSGGKVDKAYLRADAARRGIDGR